MSNNRLSRRDALRVLGGGVGAAVLGSAAHPAPTATAPCPPAVPVAAPLIDVHFHTVNLRLPGVPEAIPAPDGKTQLPPFDADRAKEARQRLAEVIAAEMKAAGFAQALCMPRHEVSDADPLGIREIEALAALPVLAECPRLYPVGFAHPERFDRDHLVRVEDALARGKVKALKAYLGYLYYGPEHGGYRPYYRLAARYKTPVIFHTGDTFSAKAMVKYAHPLQVDEVAVQFPDTRFVLAHFGNLWVTDAAQVVLKNKNVWADLSGILIGTAAQFAAMARGRVIDRAVDRIKQAIEFVGDPGKFLFGSDWPLAPLTVYRDFVRRLFPEEHHQAVFRDNARALFGL